MGRVDPSFTDLPNPFGAGEGHISSGERIVFTDTQGTQLDSISLQAYQAALKLTVQIEELKKAGFDTGELELQRDLIWSSREGASLWENTSTS